MRKYVLLIVLIITCILFFLLVFNGLKIGNKNLIYSYEDVEVVSNEKKQIVSDLKQKNGVEFESKKIALNSAVKDYKKQKNIYDTMVSEGKIKKTEIKNLVNLYDIDFLWAIIGNYATNNEITLQLDISKASENTVVSPEYCKCDLNFTVTGEYINITNFIYDIENDENLNFEIRNFLMEKGGENIQATFVVKDISINSANLLSVPTASFGGYTDAITDD